MLYIPVSLQCGLNISYATATNAAEGKSDLKRTG